VTELLQQGAVVTVLDLPNADWDNLPRDAKRLKADILKPATMKGAFDGIKIIYHLAARTDIDGTSLEDYSVNFEGTKNLIQAAADSKQLQRFVFYSTQLVVGLFNETRFIDESEPYRTKTHYGQSKIEGEKVVQEYCSQAGIKHTIIRPTSVYGPWGEAPYKDFFQAIKRRRYCHVGKADNLVSLVYVKNLIALTILVSLSDQAINQTYFGNDFHPYTMRQIVDTAAAHYKVKIPTVPNIVITPIAYGLGLFKVLGFNVPLYPFRLKNIKASYCYDIQKSLRIGYNPQFGLAEGITETLEWYDSRELIKP
jgi:nucleoside-diphosphate-sugar epimerase